MNLKDELAKLLADIPDRTELPGREFKRMVHGAMDKCGDAPPQGLVDELRKLVSQRKAAGQPVCCDIWEQEINEILSRYKVPATESYGLREELEVYAKCISVLPSGKGIGDNLLEMLSRHKPNPRESAPPGMVEEMRNLYREEVIGSACESCGAGMWKRFNEILGKKED